MLARVGSLAASEETLCHSVDCLKESSRTTTLVERLPAAHAALRWLPLPVCFTSLAHAEHFRTTREANQEIAICMKPRSVRVRRASAASRRSPSRRLPALLLLPPPPPPVAAQHTPADARPPASAWLDSPRSSSAPALGSSDQCLSHSRVVAWSMGRRLQRHTRFAAQLCLA